MSGSEVERQIERSRRRLERLRERARRDGHGAGSHFDEAIEELGHTLEELSVTLEEISSANEEIAEAQLAAEEHARRYHELFRFAPDAYVVTDERGVIRELNAAAERQFGRSARYLAGKPLLPLVAEPDRDTFLACLSALRQGPGRLADREIRFGSRSLFDASVSAVSELRDGDIEIRWMLRDVSALKERDAFRDQIERHLESVIWLQQLDPPRVLHVSPAYEVVWGRSLSALQENPRAWIEGVHPEDRARMEAVLGRLVAGEAVDVEYRILRPDGEVRWIHDRGTPFGVGRGGPDRAAGIAEDVTRTKRIEAALRKAEQRRRAAALAAERAEARERRSLASDLHDSLGQTLALVQTRLAALRDDEGQTGQGARLRDIESLVAEAAERTRTLTFRLSPPSCTTWGWQRRPSGSPTT